MVDISNGWLYSVDMNNTNELYSIPPKSLEKVIDFIRKGGRVCVQTCTRMTIIDAKCLNRFEKAGHWLLKEDGEGYRLRSGKGSVYVSPGLLCWIKN